MSWIPLIIAAWLVADAVVVAAFVGLSRHRAARHAARRPHRGQIAQVPPPGPGPLAH